MFFIRLKNFTVTVLALALSFFVLFVIQGLQISRFSWIEGERSFYLKSPSSQAVIKKQLSLWECFEIKGESVRFLCEDREKTLSEILQSYDAEILFGESADGSISYYCITPQWLDGVHINGKFVNLHIAFNGEYCVVGAPIIFGGF